MKRINLFLIVILIINISLINSLSVNIPVPTNTTLFNVNNSLDSGKLEGRDTATLKTYLQGLYDLVYVKISEITNYVGNWTADKPNYWNSTQILNGTLALNSSFLGYVPFNNSLSNLDFNGKNMTNITSLNSQYVNSVDFTSVTVDGTNIIWEIII